MVRLLSRIQNLLHHTTFLSLPPHSFSSLKNQHSLVSRPTLPFSSFTGQQVYASLIHSFRYLRADTGSATTLFYLTNQADEYTPEFQPIRSFQISDLHLQTTYDSYLHQPFITSSPVGTYSIQQSTQLSLPYRYCGKIAILRHSLVTFNLVPCLSYYCTSTYSTSRLAGLKPKPGSQSNHKSNHSYFNFSSHFLSSFISHHQFQLTLSTGNFFSSIAIFVSRSPQIESHSLPPDLPPTNPSISHQVDSNWILKRTSTTTRSSKKFQSRTYGIQ